MRVVAGPLLEVPDVTLPGLLLRAAREHPHRAGFLVRTRGPDGPFEAWSWEGVARRVREAADGLAAVGVEPGDKVAILSETRAEWALAYFAALSAGATVVTVYPTLTAEQVRFLMEDSRPRVAFVENAEQRAKLAKAPEGLRTFTFDPADGSDTLDDLRATGRQHAGAADGRVDAVGPDDPSTIVYTSGTTGVPKGVVLSHRNFVAASRGGIALANLHPHGRGLAFLPFAHSLGLFVLVLGVDLAGELAFGSPRTLQRDLQEVRPTLLAAVPRLYDRMTAELRRKVDAASPLQRRLFAEAERVAVEHARAEAEARRPGARLAAEHAFFERLVYRKLRERLGFQALQACVTGAAAMRPELLLFFRGAGVNILEGYGLTETAAPSNCNPPTRVKPGTVGPPLPGVELALADDGEVLIHGPNVFAGYHERPDENAQAFVEVEGKRWFRTGDLGEVDADGYLRIVDRKKELEVLDTGKKIAPVVVEERLKTSPYVAEALLVATGRKFAACLLQPDHDALLQWARREGVPFDERAVRAVTGDGGRPETVEVGEDLLTHPDVRRLYRTEVEKANRELADFERVRTFDLVPRAWSVDADELTPSLKKKRRVILKREAERIERLFAAEKKAP